MLDSQLPDSEIELVTLEAAIFIAREGNTFLKFAAKAAVIKPCLLLELRFRDVRELLVVDPRPPVGFEPGTEFRSPLLLVLESCRDALESLVAGSTTMESDSSSAAVVRLPPPPLPLSLPDLLPATGDLVEDLMLRSMRKLLTMLLSRTSTTRFSREAEEGRGWRDGKRKFKSARLNLEVEAIGREIG